MTTSSSDGVSVVPAARSVPIVAGDTPAMREWAEQLVARARAEGVELTGDDGLLTAMIRQVLQTGLEVELSDHLGHERCWRRRVGGPAGPQRHVRSADGAETSTTSGRPVGECDLAVCEGPDDR